MKIPLGVEPRFGRLVRHLESWAMAHPLSYKLMVLVVALCGYGYLLGLLLLVIVTALLVVFETRIFFIPYLAIYVLAPFFAFGALIIKAMWVKYEPPTGYELTAATAPRLFALIDKIRRAANGPRLHGVLVDSDFNASVHEVPRLGVFGWSRRYLVLGLPLLQCLREDEVTAVLAHEYGHLAGRHAAFGSWIYRLRMIWWRIAWALQYQSRWKRWLFMPFYAGYVPYFNAYSFVLARANEYEADRTSREIAGADAAASALTRFNTVGHYLSTRFWPDLFKTANNHAEPPYLPLARLREQLRDALPESFAAAGFNMALAQATDLGDTHPSLQDRLRALGVTAVPPDPVDRSAADRLLDPDVVGEIVSRLDSEWQSATLDSWRNYFDRSRQDRRALTDLDNKAAQGASTLQERLKRAALTEQFVGEAACVPLYRALVNDEPKSAAARYNLGRILIGNDDADGLKLLEEAMVIDDRFVAAGCELAYLHLMRTGQPEVGESYRERLATQQKLEQRAAEERIGPRLRDRFEPHGLSEAELAPLVERLRGYHALRRAYLVRKRVSLLPHRPFFILALISTHSPRNLSFSLARLVAESIELPSEGHVIHITWRKRWLLWRIRRFPSAMILRKY